MDYKKTNYIFFYNTKEGKLAGKIHYNGETKFAISQTGLNKLIEICLKYGYDVQGPGQIVGYGYNPEINEKIQNTIENICKEYIQYLKQENKVLYLISDILQEMRLVRKNPTFGKKIVPGTLAAIIATGAYSSLNNVDENLDIMPEVNSSFNTENLEAENDNEKNTINNYTYSFNNNIIVPEVTQPYNNDNNLFYTAKQTADLNSMFESNENEYHYYFDEYDEYSNMQCMENAKRYDDIFEKYSKMYGIDKNILLAIAAQEGSGNHYENIGIGSAEGIMQLERNVHTDTTIYAYNFEKNDVEEFNITAENMKDLDTNIKIAAMLFRNHLEFNNYNIPMAIQEYNFGGTNLNNVLNYTCKNEEEKEYRRDNINKTDWMKYRDRINTGDPLYIEHVASQLGKEKSLTCKKRPVDKFSSPEKVTIKIINDGYKKDYNYGL